MWLATLTASRDACRISPCGSKCPMTGPRNGTPLCYLQVPKTGGKSVMTELPELDFQYAFHGETCPRAEPNAAGEAARRLEQ